MKKDLAIIQLKEKTTLLAQAKETIASLQIEVQNLQERITWAEKLEQRNAQLTEDCARLRNKINAVHEALT